MTKIRLGYEIPSGREVEIPIRHTAVTGQTQESGKTTTLEALISRSGLPAVAFITKRGESSFQDVRTIPPYFRERADWQFVSALLEATLRERMKFERSWIMRVSKGAHTLSDVHRNVRKALETAKGLNENVYMTLDAYLQIVIPQIDKLPYTDSLSLAPGLNVIDLGGYSTELQALVIRSVLEWVYENERNTIVIIPEAWEFIPLQRGSPVKLAAEMFIRKSAGLKNYLWLDSQDIAGVAAEVRRQIAVWILGVQRDEHEIARALKLIPQPRPKPDEVMTLGKGEFFACFGKEMHRTYVEPAWMRSRDALLVAKREAAIDDFSAPVAKARKDGDEMYEQLWKDEKARADRLEQRVKELENKIAQLVSPRVASPPEVSPKPALTGASVNDDEVAMSLTVARPVIDLTVRKYVVEANDSDQFGLPGSADLRRLLRFPEKDRAHQQGIYRARLGGIDRTPISEKSRHGETRGIRLCPRGRGGDVSIGSWHEGEREGGRSGRVKLFRIPRRPVMSMLVYSREELKLPLPLHVVGEQWIERFFSDPHYCYFCDCQQRFLCDRICVEGYIGACERCGDERLVRFKRTTVEVCA